MVVWLRPERLLAIVTSLYYCSQLVSSKTYEKFWCATEEGQHQLSCPDESALLTDVTIRKVYRRTEMCEPDDHSDYLVHCQGFIDASNCEGKKTCSIEVSSRNYIQCENKKYAPTYFFVKYTCTQIHTMCVDKEPIRNTLYGFIVSPAYPHPMADNLKCSINIEADPSMFIELAPIEIRLQDAIKCRSEYLEIFGYLNSATNSSSFDDTVSSKDSQTIWKSYHTWCGAQGSINNPLHHSRYLISSNSLYMSLQTAVSKKPRYFKIRYKVVPSIARSQYNHEGVAYDSLSGPSLSTAMTMTTPSTISVTTIIAPMVDNNNMTKSNGTIVKRTYKKEIIIGIVAGVVVLILAILIGVGVFLLIKRRRSSAAAAAAASKPSASTANPGKKPGASSTSTNNTVSKGAMKSPDKAPLLEPTATNTSAAPAKRKLIPERTVQIADVNTSRFKNSTTPTTTNQTNTTGKDSTSGNSEPATATVTSPAPSILKPVLTAADSGIYGADLSDDVPPVTKSMASVDPPKIYGADLPDKSDPIPPVQTSIEIPPAPTPTSVTIATNPLSENPAKTPISPDNSTVSAIVVPNNVTTNPMPNEKDVLLPRNTKHEHLDETVKSAYSHLIDATMSENEGPNGGGGSLASSASQSRRTSNVKQPLLSHEANNIEGISRKVPPFNPLHVILKKDANKYYTTEYI